MRSEPTIQAVITEMREWAWKRPGYTDNDLAAIATWADTLAALALHKENEDVSRMATTGDSTDNLTAPTNEVPRQRFRKKPVVIDALQWRGDFDLVDAWLDALGYDEDGDETTAGPAPVLREDHNPTGDVLLVITTLEGEMTAQVDDWIIRGTQGEFYPCKPDIFAEIYEPVTGDGHQR